MTVETESSGTGGERKAADDDSVVIRLPSLRRLMRQCLPDETVQHLQAAQREQLLAIRSLVDAAIERLEKVERDESRRRQEPIDISVE